MPYAVYKGYTTTNNHAKELLNHKVIDWNTTESDKLAATKRWNRYAYTNYKKRNNAAANLRMKNVNNQTPSLTKTTLLECKNNANCTFTIAIETV